MKLLRRVERFGIIQVAPQAPIRMATPSLRLTKGGLDPVTVEETDHFRLMREFWSGPKEFVEAMLEE